MTYEEFCVNLYERTGGHALTPSERLSHMAMKLASEAGEVCDAVVHQVCPVRAKNANLKEELGDVLFFVAAIARSNQWSLEDIKEANMEKLLARFYVEKKT